MKIGTFVGIAAGARPDSLATIAQHAERLGYATLLAGEHVVMFDTYQSKYPYSETGEVLLPRDTDLLDPIVALSYAAALTRTIKLATGISLIAEHNPVVLAKQIASLDYLCGGSFALGIGIGWSQEEFSAVGVPFERRAQRTREYLEAMRSLWREERASFAGELVRFEGARMNPKPVAGDQLPVYFGGESHARAKARRQIRHRMVGVEPESRGGRRKDCPAASNVYQQRTRSEPITGHDDARHRPFQSRSSGRLPRRRS